MQQLWERKAAGGMSSALPITCAFQGLLWISDPEDITVNSQEERGAVLVRPPRDHCHPLSWFGAWVSSSWERPKCLSLRSSAPCFLLKFSFFMLFWIVISGFFPLFPAGPHEDSVPFRLRKHSLFYSCQLSGAHVGTGKLRQLLPQSVCPWPEVAAPSGSLESAPLAHGLWFTLQNRRILKLAPACADSPGWELEIQDIKISVPSSRSCCRSSSLERSRAGIERC